MLLVEGESGSGTGEVKGSREVKESRADVAVDEDMVEVKEEKEEEETESNRESSLVGESSSLPSLPKEGVGNGER